MTKKDRYIGCFKIKDSVPHGGNKVVRDMKVGDDVTLHYDPTNKIILVQWNNGGKAVAVGELVTTGDVERFMLPLLLCKKGNELFECEISSHGGSPLNVNRLYVDVWVKESSDAPNNNKK